MGVDLVWSPQAREDLLEIYVVIGRDSPDAAERLYDAIEARAGMLADYPRMGLRRPDTQLGMRVLVEGPYLILYETHPDADAGPVDRVDVVRGGWPTRLDQPILRDGEMRGRKPLA